MHLFLLIPSISLLILLFAHSWNFRGKKITALFFGSCFTFGVIRGNLIHWIVINCLEGKSLPYMFVQPVVR